MTVAVADDLTDPRELIVNAKTGAVRQAGASSAWGDFVTQYKQTAEKSLYHFAKGVLKIDVLTRPLHLPVCAWLTTSPPNRKLLMLPREHMKTTIVSQALPVHIHIQPAESNIYFRGEHGSEQRILLVGETEPMAMQNLDVIKSHYEGNVVLRALWPHICWDKPRKDARRWNETSIILPRPREFRDPSIKAIGVGGAITGAHPSVIIDDDLTTEKAANSPVVMADAIRWYTASKALVNSDTALRFTVGTRWSVTDLYDHIEKNEPSVAIMRRAVIENGKLIMPRSDLPPHRRHLGWTMAKYDEAKRHFGALFPLLFMNTAIDAAISDFDVPQIPRYRLVGSTLVFDEARDAPPVRPTPPAAPGGVYTGQRLTRELWSLLARDGVRLRAS